MSKIAIFGDTHLLMQFHEKYDKFVEFKRFLDQVLNDKPSAIALLGDFVDKRQSLQGRMITWGEGSDYQVKIEKMIEATNVQWYAMNGNHDDERVYPSIEKGAKNFTVAAITKFGENGSNVNPVQIGKINAWFAPVPHDAPAEVTREAFQELEGRRSTFTKNKNRHVLFLHVNMIRRGQDIGIDDEVLDILSHFDKVIDGHEHVYMVHKKKKFIVFMPATFPTWVVKNRGFVRKYEFKAGKLVEGEKSRNPFGYLLLDDETLEIEFKPFAPTMAHVEILYDVTGVTIPQVRADWKTIAARIHDDLVGTGQFKDILVLPVLTGTLEAAISLTFDTDVATVFNGFKNVYVSPFTSDENLKRPSFDIDKLKQDRLPTRETAFQNAKAQVTDIVKKLAEKKISVEPAKIAAIIGRIEAQEAAFFNEKTRNVNAAKYVGGVIENLITELNNTFGTTLDVSIIDPVLASAIKAKTQKTAS